MKRVTARQIWDGFQTLLDARADPDSIHRYLVEYPALLPLWRPRGNKVYSKLALGDGQVADFAFTRDDPAGLRWHLIALEQPGDPLFDKVGEITAPLYHALRRLRGWHDWFTANRDHVAAHFPNGGPIGASGLPDPHLTLIIGRRHPDWWSDDRQRLQRMGALMDIRVYDGLRSNLDRPALEDARPLTCCLHAASGEQILSKTEIEISYYVHEPADGPPGRSA